MYKMIKHLSLLQNTAVLQPVKSDVTPKVSDLSGFRYAYLGHAPYHLSDTAVALEPDGVSWGNYAESLSHTYSDLS
jgi:hypothetical protein